MLLCLQLGQRDELESGLNRLSLVSGVNEYDMAAIVSESESENIRMIAVSARPVNCAEKNAQ